MVAVPRASGAVVPKASLVGKPTSRYRSSRFDQCRWLGAMLAVGYLMGIVRTRIALFSVAVLAWAAETSQLPSQGPGIQWHKGNLHSHMINSDGGRAPDAVARWYQQRRYHSLALTGLNYFSDSMTRRAWIRSSVPGSGSS